jgi:hypothetical protein
MRRSKMHGAMGRLLLDHLVGTGEHGRRNVDPKCFGSLEIDYYLDLRGLLNRKIRRLLSLENSINITGCASAQVD